MKIILKHTLLSLALLAGAFTVKAQVKIGSSPTTIAPTSNLEVQATNGKKVIVDKAVGTVQVENLPAGDATNAIVVADPTGVLKQVNAASIAPPVYIFEAIGIQTLAPQGSPTALPFETDGLMNPSSAAADRFDSKTWKAPVAGIYRIDLDVNVLANNNTNPRADAFVEGVISKNITRVATGHTTVTAYGTGAGRGQASLIVSKVLSLAAGDAITVGMVGCSGCGIDNFWGTTRITIQRLK